MSEEDFYKQYRKAMMSALQVGNNKKADFLAGKLLTVRAYQRDETMLFAAMMAANGEYAEEGYAAPAPDH